jgi:hypothetical protein
VLAERLASQGLAVPAARTPEEVVHRLLAVQGQDRRAASLAVRSRSTGLAATDVDKALTDRRSLLITWLNRGTLHLVAADDYWWLHPLTTPQQVLGNTRRLRQEGVTADEVDRGVEVVTDAVTAEGPLTRAELRERLDAAGIPTAGQALVHLLMAASLRGHLVRGPVRAGENAYVAVREWLGEPPAPIGADDALARLARRYLAGHGPADARDLAAWAGIRVGDARRAFAAIAGDLVEAAADADADRSGDAAAQTGDLADLVDRVPAAVVPSARLLGAFDPLLLGWASRAPFVGAHHAEVASGGVIRPVALVDGRVAGTWGLADGTISLRMLEKVPRAAQARLDEDAADVLRFLALPARPPVRSTGPTGPRPATRRTARSDAGSRGSPGNR